jgi:hypothetical protein
MKTKCSAIRVDHETKLASVLDVIRLRNGIRSNHAAALLALISAKHTDLEITKGRVNSKGRETPLADVSTLERILALCPIVRASTEKATEGSVLTKVRSASRAAVTRRALKTAPLLRKQPNRKCFGQLSHMLKQIHKIG